ncbi:MAG: prolipoprotein diacylglyceryl transferase [Verrucomicrobiae bacterium]|nr:prolipoprotein diacylglyceryl transferase [Verrucomicrobiae bacterium]
MERAGSPVRLSTILFAVPHQLLPNGSAIYLLLLLVALIGSVFWWSRRFRSDPRLIQIFAGAVIGAFAGAKLAYLLAEGWLHWGHADFWYQLANGKTILGALLGGYAGVEGVKKLVGYREPTGDGFAAVAPLGIALGRLGCLAHGCCLGIACESAHWFTVNDGAGMPRWPAPWIELAFNLGAFVVFLWFRHRGILPGQHFHLYLIAYGLFRFVHEFARDTPRVLGLFSGYQVLALMVLALGIWGFRKRVSDSMGPDRRSGLPRDFSTNGE